MPDKIRRVCVIGAGTMGSGIAAHLANIGYEVSLLDRSLDEAKASFERAKSLRPPHFYLPGTADTIRLGSVGENGDLIREADWVCEAIIEKLDAKKQLFEFLDPLIRRDAMVSTNTSGIQIQLLIEGRSESFQKRFIGTHFFNPPRYLKLLELIPTDKTDPDVIKYFTDFLEHQAARRVVLAKDTPGFITNRFGMWSMYKATHVAEKLGLTIEQVDDITGPFLGRPRSGSFRLNDLVGLDIMEDIAKNLVERCPEDPNTGNLANPGSVTFLVDRGWIGNKAGQGYYRKEGKELMSLDLKTLAYRQRQEPELAAVKELGKLPLAERLTTALDRRDEVGEFLREYLLPTLRYADYLKAEISHSVQDFDRAMMWGFGWEAGPFAMIDMIGAEKVGVSGGAFFGSGTQRTFEGSMVNLRPEPAFSTIRDFPIIDKKETFNLRDLGDGVTALALTTKMGVISPRAVDEMTEVLTAGSVNRLVFTSEAKSFSAGFDLKFFVERCAEQDYAAIEAAIDKFQQLGLLFGKIPSVAAVFGHCLGGGFEMAASCSMIAANAETQIGLPEVKVGLIPGGGGTAIIRLRSQSSAKAVAEGIRLLASGQVTTCADQARQVGYLRREDVTVYHPDMLLFEAKKLALTAKPVAQPQWATVEGPIYGISDVMLAEMKKNGDLSDHDIFIGGKLKEVLAKSTSFADALVRERKCFIDLAQDGLSQARMKAMLEHGKPLRN